MLKHFLLIVGVLTISITGAVLVYQLAGSSDGGEAETEIERVNELLAEKGVPTLRADFDLYPPTADAAPSQGVAPRTPAAPTVPMCAGGSIGGADEIVQSHGSAKATVCAAVGSYFYFVTEGSATEPGGIAVYECGEGCSFNAVQAPGASWAFHPAPNSGAVKVMIFNPPSILLIGNGGKLMCFDLETRMYDTTPGCAPEQAVPSEFLSPEREVSQVVPTPITTLESP